MRKRIEDSTKGNYEKPNEEGAEMLKVKEMNPPQPSPFRGGSDES
ncbi:MAG: hypothetical protein WDA22_14425 [Bacteroidota bacterium]